MDTKEEQVFDHIRKLGIEAGGNGWVSCAENDTENPESAPGLSLSDTLHDLYHAREIIRLHGGDIRYCGKLGGFLVWDGARWSLDETGEIWRVASRTASEVFVEELDKPGGPNTGVQRWALKSLRRCNLANAIKQLEAQPQIIETHDAFDADPWLFNVQNGTIDLRTGELREHRRDDMITRITPAVYDPGCDPPTRWLQFLSEIFDGNTDIIDFVRRACGYALTGSVSEGKLFLLHGHGGNGKSTFLNTLMHMMGGHARRLVANLLFTNRRDMRPYAFADLRGCRLAGVAGVESGRKLAGATLKELTGGDRLTARRRRAEHIEFEPTHTLFICCDHLPAIRGTGDALWRRILVIPFSVTIPEEQQDSELPEKLRSEASGILNWLVAGCLEWQQQGLAPPGEVADATGAYRSDVDVLGEFLDECCMLDPDGGLPNPELRKAYEAWCERTGERPMSATALGLGLKERGFVQKRMGHSNTRTWLGIALQPFEEEISDEELRQIEEILEKLEGYDRERMSREGSTDQIEEGERRCGNET